MWFERHYVLEFHREITTVDGLTITINMPIVSSRPHNSNRSTYMLRPPGRIYRWRPSQTSMAQVQVATGDIYFSCAALPSMVGV